MGDGRVRMILEIRDLFDLAAKTKGISPKEIRRKLAKEKSNTEEITDETDMKSNENENVEEKEISDDEDAEDFSDEKYEGEIPEDYSDQESDEKLDKEEMVLEQ